MPNIRNRVVLKYNTEDDAKNAFNHIINELFGGSTSADNISIREGANVYIDTKDCYYSDIQVKKFGMELPGALPI